MICIPVVSSFLLLKCIQLYGDSKTCLSILHFINICAVSSFFIIMNTTTSFLVDMFLFSLFQFVRVKMQKVYKAYI